LTPAKGDESDEVNFDTKDTKHTKKKTKRWMSASREAPDLPLAFFFVCFVFFVVHLCLA